MNYPNWNIWRCIFALYLTMPVIFISSMFGTKLTVTINIDTVVTAFLVTIVPALLGYYLAKWEPIDELEAETWKKQK